MSAGASPVGLFGGTFDPVHYGHLRIALEFAEALALGEVRMLPAAVPPHRDSPEVSAEQRCEMLRLALADDPLLRLDDRELHRQGPSYTLDTLRELRAELGAERPLCLLLGMDAFLGLCDWYHWQQLPELAHLVVAQRPGWSFDSPHAELAALVQARRREPAALTDSPAGGICFLPLSRLQIAASDMRARLQAGRSIRYLTPEPVRHYIEEQGLYR